VSRLSKRYAKALFSLAVEEKQLDLVKNDVFKVSGLLTKGSGFTAFIINPLTNGTRQMKIVQELFSGALSEMVLNFLMLLSKKKRLNILPDIFADFDRLILVHNNQIHAEVFSCSPLTSGQIDKIQQRLAKLTNKEILIKTSLNKSLLGGFTIRVEDLIIDNSIRYQLAKLKEKLVA